MTGALLAGGRARRLGGVAKGLIEVDGEAIAARLLRLLREVCEDVFVVGDPAGPYADLGVPVVADRVPGKGAPGGVHTALRTAAPGWVCVLACDLPRFDRPTLDALRARAGAQDAVLARVDGRLQPTAGLWHTRAAPTIEALLPTDPGFGRIVAALQVEVVEGLRAGAFFNLNTPADRQQMGAAPSD